MNTITLTLEATTENLVKLQRIFGDENKSAPVKPIQVVKTEEPEVKEEKTETPVEEVKKITKTEIRAKAIELTKAGKQEQLKNILNGFGAEKLSALKEENYAECFEKLSEVM